MGHYTHNLLQLIVIL